MNAKETLTNWLEAGDTQRVLAGLAVVCKRWGHKDLASDISFQSGRYQDLQTQQLKRIISHADYQLESAKIRQGLIELVNSFSEHWMSEELAMIPPTKNLFAASAWKKWATIIAGTIAFGGAMAEFSGYSLRDIFQTKVNSPAQTAPRDTLRRPDVQISTSGEKSPAISAPGGDVNINYGEPTQAKRDSSLQK